MTFLKNEYLPSYLKYGGVFAFFISFMVFALYLYQFGNLTLSNDLEDWARFGSYVGGVLTALLSFLSLLIVLITVFIQSKLLDRAATAQEAATDHSRLEGLLTLQKYYHQRYDFCKIEYEKVEETTLSSKELFLQDWQDADSKLKIINAEIADYYELLIGQKHDRLG